jgi:tetratricopeptide (TPR) repeat protein
MKHRDTKTQSLLLRAIALALRGHKGALKNILRRAFVSLCLCVSVFTASQRTTAPISAIRLNNLGVGYMNQARIAEALQMFRRAEAQDPTLFAARLNEGIALLNSQQLAEARDVLLDATRRQPQSARAWYNLGIVYRTLAQTDAAIDAFEHVARLDAADADTLYFLGQLHLQARRYDQAIAAFEKCLSLDSLHLSGEFGLARAYQLSGNEAAAAQHLARFDQLTQSKIGKQISLTYGEQGPYSTAEPVGGAEPAPQDFAVRFVASALSAGRVGQSAREGQRDRFLQVAGAGACFIDFDDDGRPDLLLPSENGGRAAILYRNTGGGRFSDVTAQAGLDAAGEAHGCAIGDYDNDRRDDIVLGLSNGIAIYHNEGGGRFRNTTSSTGIVFNGVPLGLTFVDFDHDGDLDLYISRFTNFSVPPNGEFNFSLAASPAPNALWRNNGNGTFTDWTAQSGLAGDAQGASLAALASDLNNDRAIDLVVTGLHEAATIFTNPREGPFRRSQPWDSTFPPDPVGVVAFDFNKDGFMDLAFTHWSQPGLSLWKNVGGTRFERVVVPEPQWARGWGITALDIDNDGWIDLAAVGERDAAGSSGGILLLRNLGDGRFADVTAETSLRSVRLDRPRAIAGADIDGDGDTDLIVTQNGGAPIVLKNDGGNRRSSVRLSFLGLADNRGGLGSKVEVFAGGLRQKWEMQSSSGYLGQNAREVVAGMNQATEADVVRLLWPTGVVQDEVQLASGRRHLIREIDRRGSSCPVVWVWNGEHYEFISDMIGPGIVGHWVAPGETNTPDPTEYLRIEGRHVKPRHGRLSFRFAEVMEELVYLDQVRLIAIDHPADIDVYPNEYFASTPPFPEFRIIASRNARPPRSARDGEGRNVLPQLLRRDRRYVTGFDPIQFPGFSKMHYLELGLPEPYVSGPLRLLMHGFIEYFSATSGFAAHQAGIEPVVPFLEVQKATGEWSRVSDDIGFPAGLARTMVADLTGKVPPGTSRIRIGTNLNIYWDQILIDQTPDVAGIETQTVPLVEASLRFHGYPRQVEGSPKSDLQYVYEDISATGPYARHAGNFTAYGDVLPLLKAVDDQFVIIASGDEVALEFDPSSLKALRPGWSRDYFLYADGFAKDMDFYESLSDTVEPLPFHSMPGYPYPAATQYPSLQEYVRYRLTYNTRYISSAAGASYRAQYRNMKAR